MTDTVSPIPKEAKQALASIRSLTSDLAQIEKRSGTLRVERQKLMLHASRAGCTYEAIATATGLRASTVATEIGHARRTLAAPSLPRGRRKGISPKYKNPPAAVAVA